MKKISLFTLMFVLILSAVSFAMTPVKPIDKMPPIIAPHQLYLQGTVEVVSIKGIPTKIELKTNTGLINLTGNTKGLEKCSGKLVSVVGNYNNIYYLSNNYNAKFSVNFLPRSFNVISYKVLDQKNVNVFGTVSLSYIGGKHFQLRSGNQLYILTGNVVGLDKYLNKPVIITGTISNDTLQPLLKTPITKIQTLNVVSYRPIILVFKPLDLTITR